MLWREYELEYSGICFQIRNNLLRTMHLQVIEDQTDFIAFGVFLIQLLQKLDIIVTVMCITY